MALGFSMARANAILNYHFKGVTYTPSSTYFAKLHLGDPGAAGTANPAAATARKAVTFGTNSTANDLANTAVLAWSSSEVTADETWTHITLWSASSGGTFEMSGSLPVPKSVTAGQAWSIVIGDLDISLAVAS